MKRLPFSVRFELEGWELFWAHLTVTEKRPEGLTLLREEVAAGVRERYPDNASIAQNATVSALRRLFKAAGTDPGRYRPASEALLRRLVKGDPFPAIQPLVDVNNCLSASLAVPCCVMVDGSFGPSLVWRSGQEGESYESLRGPFQLEKRPLLLDESGPLDTPITGNVRVKVDADTEKAWLVAYLPLGVASPDDAWRYLESFQEHSGVVAERYESATK